MKFIATLILNAIVTLGLIAFCFNYLLKPYIESEKELMQRVIGQKANYAHFVGIDEKVDVLNAELNEQKTLMKDSMKYTRDLIEVISDQNTSSESDSEFIDLEEIRRKYGPASQPATKPNASQEQ